LRLLWSFIQLLFIHKDWIHETYDPLRGLRRNNIIVVNRITAIHETYDPLRGLRRNNIIVVNRITAIHETYDPLRGLRHKCERFAFEGLKNS